DMLSETNKKEKNTRPYQERQVQRPSTRLVYSSSYGTVFEFLPIFKLLVILYLSSGTTPLPPCARDPKVLAHSKSVRKSWHGLGLGSAKISRPFWNGQVELLMRYNGTRGGFVVLFILSRCMIQGRYRSY